MKDANFEKSLEKSKEILEKLVNPEITLSESVTLYKKGMDELKNASKLLEEAKLKFETYQKDDNPQSDNL